MIIKGFTNKELLLLSESVRNLEETQNKIVSETKDQKEKIELQEIKNLKSKISTRSFKK